MQLHTKRSCRRRLPWPGAAALRRQFRLSEFDRESESFRLPGGRQPPVGQHDLARAREPVEDEHVSLPQAVCPEEAVDAAGARKEERKKEKRKVHEEPERMGLPEWRVCERPSSLLSLPLPPNSTHLSTYPSVFTLLSILCLVRTAGTGLPAAVSTPATLIGTPRSVGRPLTPKRSVPATGPK